MVGGGGGVETLSQVVEVVDLECQIVNLPAPNFTFSKSNWNQVTAQGYPIVVGAGGSPGTSAGFVSSFSTISQQVEVLHQVACGSGILDPLALVEIGEILEELVGNRKHTTS